METKVSILLIDDEPEILEIIKFQISFLDANIVTANNGRVGLDRALTASFDVILTDLNMPLVGGFEVISSLRKENIFTPVIIVTGYGDKEKTIRALRLGAFDFIDKPWEEEYLKETVSKALEIGRALKSLSNIKETKQELIHVLSENSRISAEFLESKMVGSYEKN